MRSDGTDATLIPYHGMALPGTRVLHPQMLRVCSDRFRSSSQERSTLRHRGATSSDRNLGYAKRDRKRIPIERVQFTINSEQLYHSVTLSTTAREIEGRSSWCVV